VLGFKVGNYLDPLAHSSVTTAHSAPDSLNRMSFCTAPARSTGRNQTKAGYQARHPRRYVALERAEPQIRGTQRMFPCAEFYQE
jgi:hypothetical protein